MKKSVSKKQTISLVVLAIVLPAVAYGVVGYFMGLPPFEKDSPYGEHTVNYEKSDAEKKVESALKDDPSNKLVAQQQTDQQQSAASDPATGKQVANVLITYVGVQGVSVVASGYVSNVVEDSGVCVFTFTNNGTTIQKSSAPLTNASSTTCSTVRFPASDLIAGTWSVQLTYTSSTSYGESSAKEFVR